MAEPVREGLFGRDERGRPYLIAGRCRTCDRPQFPKPPRCGHCGDEAVEELQVSGRGATLWARTTVRAAPPGYHGPVPYDLGVVEVPEGLRVISRLEGTAELDYGAPLGLALVPIAGDGREVLTWAFEPLEG